MGKFSDALNAHQKIQERIGTSRTKLGTLRHEATHHEPLLNDRLTVFAAGSLGRLESGSKSDFDVFMIADSSDRRIGEKPSISKLEEYEVFASLISINQKLSYPKFSGDGRFLKTYELKEMIQATGSPRDDSENLFTARILLLLESQPITNEPLYNRATLSVTENYFRDGLGRDDFRPLLLMNDLLRYWRTLCLNYEAYRNEAGRPWLKKNLNLKFSRKLTIYSTILSLLAGQASSASAFAELCHLTPIERLAAALDAVDDPKLYDGFQVALSDYESFLSAKEKQNLDGDEHLSARQRLSNTADRFGRFLHDALESPLLDGQLRRYILI